MHDYLLGSKYDKKSYAMPARFWFKVCTRMDYLQAASSVCASHFKRNIEKAASLDADRLFVEIFKLLPPDKRRCSMTASENYNAAFARLAKSKFRSRFHLAESDRAYIESKGMETIRRHCEASQSSLSTGASRETISGGRFSMARPASRR